MTGYGSIQGMISLGPWGGPAGGDHWSFKASVAITEIVITLVENNIHAISFRDASGDISGTFGGRDPNATKRVEKKILIRPSEYLISISGKYGQYSAKLVIRSLSFITNFKTYGPFGTASAADTAFSTPIADSVVVGFHGRAGYYLDELGIFVKPVDPHNGTISLGPWGGPGGDPFSFTVQGSWIKEIIVEQGDTIDSISFKDANGQYRKFGGHTVVEKKVTINGPSEYLTSISGTYGQFYGLQVIRSLSFITNHKTHGPFGTVSRDSFTIPIEGSLVIGFHGRAGSYLDSIGIIVKPAITN